jgi:hypothetical protein
MQGQFMGDEIRTIRNMMKPYEIKNCGYRFGEAMLVGIKCTVTRNMTENNEIKELVKLLRMDLGL